jgi:hypothetical protein
MKREELIKEIDKFKSRTKSFRKLLLESRDAVADIVRNHDKIAKQRSELIRIYAHLEKYIILFGNNPRMSDGVWVVTYPVYTNAFSADILQRIGPSLNAVIQDQDYILGRLDSMTNKDFKNMLNPDTKASHETNDKPATGIVNIGKGNKFNNCKISGFDRGIENKGGKTEIKDLIVEKKSQHPRIWYESWWFQAIISLVVLIIGGYLIWKFGWTK